MEIFTKEIEEITKKDLLEIEQLPNNFESHRIEYKVNYKISDPKHSNEFLRDVVSFANAFTDSMIIYGLNDNRKLIGLERKPNSDEDILQNHFINLLESRVEPKIKNYVRIQPVAVKRDRFAMIVKILASDNVIYGIKQKLIKKVYGKEVDAYEFWYRSSGNKKLMNLNEVVRHILFKNKPNLKILCFNYKIGKDISRFIKTTKTGYIKSNFRLKNIGEITANKISIRLFCTTIPTIKFLNKWNYKIKILKHDGLKLNNFPSITGQIKREKRIKNPTVVPTKRDDKVNWSFQYEIDKIAPDDSQKLPPIYINIPKNLRKGEIKFNAKIFSEEAVNYDDEILTLFWEV